MKKAAILIIISLLAASCYLPPPPVDCEFISIRKVTVMGPYKTERFILKFKSTHNLATFENEHHGVNMLLYCPLSDDDVKSDYRDSRLQINAMDVETRYDYHSTIPIYFNKGWYYYEFPINFEDQFDLGSPSELDDRRIDSVLVNKSCAPCNFVMPYFLSYQIFHTDTFCIPADSIRYLLKLDKKHLVK